MKNIWRLMFCWRVDLLLFSKYSLKCWLLLPIIIDVAIAVTVLIRCPLDVIASLCDGSIAFINQFTWRWKWWLAYCWRFNIYGYACFNADLLRLSKWKGKKVDYCSSFILFNFTFYLMPKTSFICLVIDGQQNKHYTRATLSTEQVKQSNTHSNNKEFYFCGYVCNDFVYLHRSMEIVWQFSVVVETVQWKTQAYCSFAVSLILTF